MNMKGALLALVGIAVTASAGEAVSWNGKLDHTSSIGLLLDSKTNEPVDFALMEHGGDALEALFPEVGWRVVDSMELARALPGGMTGTDAEVARKEVAVKVGKATGITYLLVVQRGGARAAKDSAESFGDHIVFQLRETADGRCLMAREYSITTGRDKLSAEGAWARSAWDSFAKDVKALRK